MQRILAAALAVALAASLPAAAHAAGPASAAPAAAADGQGRPVQADAGGRIYLSSLLHSELMNDKGDKIGEVDDILVGKDGKLELLVMVGGFLGIGNRDVLLPWSKLDVRRTERGNVVVSVPMTKDELKSIPEYKG